MHNDPSDECACGHERHVHAPACTDPDCLGCLRFAPPPLCWEDCTASYQVWCSIARGGGIWPSMISVDATDLSGTIAAHDARSLAATLLRAADVCDESTGEVFGTLALTTDVAEVSPSS